ncbi:hypothetical protein QUF80_19040 [Desulfococcaceae bacterium HSG8]|nr:hypothetical protein [Desulfococcaceae bacterium HSG8]
MGEIRSTLDLVMERTGHLTLTNEEKQEQKSREFAKKFKGLIQKFLDKTRSTDHLKRELDILSETYGITDKKILSDEVAGRLQPDQDNSMIFILLREICDSDTANLEAIFDEYEEEKGSAAQKRSSEIREHLAKNHMITGSAVVPNLGTDENWKTEMQDIKNKFNHTLMQEKNGLTA